MYRAIATTGSVLVVFALVLILTILIRKKQQKTKYDPRKDEFENFQNDIRESGVSTFYESTPKKLLKSDDLLYEVRGEISKVDFKLDDPETNIGFCSLWITDKRMLVEINKKTTEFKTFNFDEIIGFEYELEKGKYLFIFEYKKEMFKFVIRDLYALALIDLKLKESN